MWWGGDVRSVPDMPEYSIGGGWYPSGTAVGISCNDGDIYYTIDGSEPDEDSLPYRKPIRLYDRTGDENKYSMLKSASVANEYTPDYPIDKCTVLKAVAIKDGQKSPVRSETYFTGLSREMYDILPTVSISLDPEDLFNYERGIYVTGKAYDDYYMKNGFAEEYEAANYLERGRDWERKAEIEYYSENHDKIFEQAVGLRIHGGSSRALNQKSFNLYARRIYDGNDTFLYDPLSDPAERILKNKLVLRTGGEVDCYITKMRDVFMQSLVADRDTGTQKARPCNVFINGEYWGLYNIQEAINEVYFQEHYGVRPENVIYVKNERPNTDEPDAALLYEEMVEYAQDHDLSVQENYEHMKELIDIQSCIDYYAAEIYTGNPDSIFNNLVAWRSIVPGDSEYADKRWRWVLLDLDESTGMKTEYSSAEINSFVDGNYWGSILGDDRLFTSLMKNPEFKEEFKRSVTEIVRKNFDYAAASARLKELAAEYREADVQSQRRFRGDFIDEGYFPGAGYKKPYTDEDFSKDIDVIDDFLKHRGENILKYMENIE